MSEQKSLCMLLLKGYDYLGRAAIFAQVFVLLFFRLNWGWSFFISGKGKLLHHGDIVDFFSSLHLPFPDFTAWFVASVECVGGILMLLGLGARPVGLILSINMLVAYLSVEADRQKFFHFFQDRDAFFAADPFLFLLAALVIFAFGAGPISLDALIAKALKK